MSLPNWDRSNIVVSRGRSSCTLSSYPVALVPRPHRNDVHKIPIRMMPIMCRKVLTGVLQLTGKYAVRHLLAPMTPRDRRCCSSLGGCKIMMSKNLMLCIRPIYSQERIEGLPRQICCAMSHHLLSAERCLISKEYLLQVSRLRMLLSLEISQMTAMVL